MRNGPRAKYSSIKKLKINFYGGDVKLSLESFAIIH